MNVRIICPVCARYPLPGIIWPASPDTDVSRSWVARCGVCRRYSNDLRAARHMAARMGVTVALVRTAAGNWRPCLVGRAERAIAPLGPVTQHEVVGAVNASVLSEGALALEA